MEVIGTCLYQEPLVVVFGFPELLPFVLPKLRSFTKS
jgi:hypothetical protein